MGSAVVIDTGGWTVSASQRSNFRNAFELTAYRVARATLGRGGPGLIEPMGSVLGSLFHRLARRRREIILFNLTRSKDDSSRVLRLGTLICFEDIFPGLVREMVSEGAGLLVNLTNDAWYGRTSAPYQSIAMSVFRAVETKRSLVRAANTGISAFVDPAGNILEKTDIFVPGVMTAQVPVLEKRTVFVRSGYRFGMACFAFIPGLLLFRKRHR